MTEHLSCIPSEHHQGGTPSAMPAIFSSLEAVELLSDSIHHSQIEEKDIDNPARLQSAFELFSDLSIQLTESYSLLEKRVADLTNELNSVSEQRIQELKDKEQVATRLENLISFLPGGIVVLDHRGLIVESNPTAEDMLEKSLTGKLWRDVIKRCFFPKSDDGHEVSNHQGKRINIATCSMEQDGQIILLTDQTETRRLQADLSRHERLTALGKMVTTLAHQVRTPLSSAMLYGNHLLNESLSPQQHHQFTQKLLNRLHEIERQVSDMLLFIKADISLNDRITIAQLKKEWMEAIEMPLYQYSACCCWDIENTDSVLLCNKGALTGALLNLVNNSLQAMGKGGRLHIRLRKTSQHMLEIMIKDNGVGIADEIKPQVTELFYTTKPQGTGIGLSVVKSVAQSHRGSFVLHSDQPQGTCALLKLPIVIDR